MFPSIREEKTCSKESLYQAIQDGQVAGHPAWEGYIVWKNKEAYIARLRLMAERE